MGIGAAVGIGASVIGGIAGHQGASKAASKQSAGFRKGLKRFRKNNTRAIEDQRRAQASALERTGQFTQAGTQASQQLQNFLANPNQGLEQINPIVDFLRKEGFEDIQESAAAGGRLGAGGTLKDLTQFNTDLTSTIVPQLQNQRFNQLFSAAGLGQNAAFGEAGNILQTGSNISNLHSARGVAGQNAATGVADAQAQGTIGRTNALTGTLSNLSGAAGAFGGGGGNALSGGQGLQSSGIPIGELPKAQFF